MAAGWQRCVLRLSLVAFAGGCYLSHELGGGSGRGDAGELDPSRPFAACGDDGTPDLQIVIGVDVGQLPSTDAGGPVLTWLEGSCGDAPLEGRAERRGEVRWRDLDRRCAPYRVTLALEGVGARSFFDVRENLCASVTFGRAIPGDRGADPPDIELSVRGGSIGGLAPLEWVTFAGPELIAAPRHDDEGLELRYAERDGPFDIYGLVSEPEETVYVADDGSRRTFAGGLPLRIAAAWDAETAPAHGFTLDVAGADEALRHRPFRLQVGERPGVSSPRYAEATVEASVPFLLPSPGTAALRATMPGVLEGDLVTFSDGPWGRFEHTSLTAFDDAGNEVVTVSLDEGIEDVRVPAVASPPRFSGDYFSDARARFAAAGWPLVRVTVSDGPHRWIITYLEPPDPIDLRPRELPIPGGLAFDDFAFMPPLAFVRVEYVEPLRPDDRITDELPSPAAVVHESADFIYDPDEDW